MNVLIVTSNDGVHNDVLRDYYCGPKGVFASEDVSFATPDAYTINAAADFTWPLHWEVVIIDATAIQAYYNGGEALIKRFVRELLRADSVVQIHVPLSTAEGERP